MIEADNWIKASFRERIPYKVDWLGVPIIQLPEDMIIMQELIWKTKPDVIIDIGVAHGGSCIYYASLMELMDTDGFVIGIDIDIREDNFNRIKKHKMYDRIFLIEENSTDVATIDNIDSIMSLLGLNNALVCLDSNHTKEHVLNELELYKQFIKKGGYIVVFDTIASQLKEELKDNGPMEAIEEFLSKNDEFEIDKYYNKLQVSYCKNGFLKKIK